MRPRWYVDVETIKRLYVSGWRVPYAGGALHRACVTARGIIPSGVAGVPLYGDAFALACAESEQPME